MLITAEKNDRIRGASTAALLGNTEKNDGGGDTSGFTEEQKTCRRVKMGQHYRVMVARFNKGMKPGEPLSIEDLKALGRKQTCGSTYGQGDVIVCDSPESATAWLSNVQHCHSNICPRCAREKAVTDTMSARAATAAHTEAGGAFLLVTYTLRHSRADRLSNLMKSLRDAKQKFKKRKAYKDAMEMFGRVGDIQAVEVNYSGVNGWHPHMHDLVFISGGHDRDVIESVEARLASVWVDVLESCGAGALEDYGFNVQYIEGAAEAAAAYVAKIGGIYAEVAGGAFKSGRKEESIHPFQLLDSTYDDLGAALLWDEYVEAMSGVHMFEFSHNGIKQKYGVDATVAKMQAEREKNVAPVAVVEVEPLKRADRKSPDMRALFCQAIHDREFGRAAALFGCTYEMALLFSTRQDERESMAEPLTKRDGGGFLALMNGVFEVAEFRSK
jgi:hypothetical protein